MLTTQCRQFKRVTISAACMVVSHLGARTRGWLSLPAARQNSLLKQQVEHRRLQTQAECCIFFHAQIQPISVEVKYGGKGGISPCLPGCRGAEHLHLSGRAAPAAAVSARYRLKISHVHVFLYVPHKNQHCVLEVMELVLKTH